MSAYNKKDIYNKVVMFDSETKEGKILDYSFKYKGANPLKGLTGSNFSIVSKKEYRSLTSLKAIKEFLRSAVAENKRPIGLHEWAKECKENYPHFPMEEIESVTVEEVREFLGLSEKECFFIECTGGGRCFKSTDIFTHNTHLQKLVAEYET